MSANGGLDIQEEGEREKG
jgi:hypothetical protein